MAIRLAGPWTWALACLLLAAAGRAEPVDPMPFFKLDDFNALKISPGGDYYAATVPREDRTALVVLRASDLKVTASITLGRHAHVGSFWWVNDERVMFGIQERFGMREEPYTTGEISAINADGTRGEMLVGYRVTGAPVGSRISSKKGDNVYAVLVDPLLHDEKFVLIQTLPFQSDPFSRVERMNALTGRRNTLGIAPVRNATFYSDNAGVVRLVEGYNADRVSRLYYRADDKAEWKEINVSNQSGHVETPLGFSADNRVAYLHSTQADGPDAVMALDLDTFERSVALRDDTVDPLAVVHRPGTRIPVGATFMKDRQVTRFFDESSADARLQRSLEGAFGELAVNIVSATRDGGKLIVHVWGDRNPGDHYLFDAKTKEAALLISSRKWLDPEAMAPMKAIRLKARDGLELHGYFTAPLARKGDGPAPMVVMPHGGPYQVFDRWGFDPEVQMLAAAGYSVLQVNFRGSPNYGRRFAEAGMQQWGMAMQDDVTDATRWAIAEGLADPARICIHGASYGAYSALMGVAREPDLYRCASGYVGVYHLPSMHRRGDVQESRSGETYLSEWIGMPADLAAVSPTTLAERIKVPVLLAAGGEDRRAPVEHTRMMERALARAGAPVEALYYDNEGHGFYRPDNQDSYYRKLIAFLDAHIGTP
ncbi:MAG: S9 family peptidase [Lysobacteraceae bacterium]